MNDQAKEQEGDQENGKTNENAIDNVILSPSTTGGFCIGNARESDHGVERKINSWQRAFEEVIESFICTEGARRGFVANLDEIANRKVGERIRVFFPT